MIKGGLGKFRFGIFKDSFRFEFNSWSDCYILQLGFLQLGIVRKTK